MARSDWAMLESRGGRQGSPLRPPAAELPLPAPHPPTPAHTHLALTRDLPPLTPGAPIPD